MNKPMTSAIQEGLRTFIIGEIMMLIPVLTIIYSGINQDLGTFLIEWDVALAVAVATTITNLQTAIGRGIEKYLYKTGGENPLSLKVLDE